MTKQAFLTQLQNALTGLPKADIAERAAFYGEMIDDRMEEGLPEEQAVAAVGSIDEIVKAIVAETPLTKLVKEKIKPKRTLRGWEIALIVLGFPLWFPLLVAAGVVLLSLYVVIWSIDVSLWSVDLSFAALAVAGFALAGTYAVTGHGLPALAMLGLGVSSVGLTVFSFYGCLAATKGLLRLTKKAALGFKSLFVGKGSAT